MAQVVDNGEMEMRILIVEDEPAHAEAILRAFKADDPNTEILVVANLKEFRSAVAECSPDIAIMDMNLPDGRAIEVLSNQPENTDFPVLVMTSYGCEQVAVELLKAGALDYIVKSAEMFDSMPRIVSRAMREWNLQQENRSTEEKLRRSEAKLRQLTGQFNVLFNAIPDTIALISPEFKILWANTSASARLNRTPEGVISARCHNLWADSTATCDSCPVMESFKTGAPADQTIITSDNRTIELRAIPIIENGRILNIIEIGRDITEHRKLEAQFLHAQKMESIGIFAGGIAHDFNNVLTAILGYGQLALTQTEEGEQPHYCVEQILTAADRAAHLTKDLLQFSRKEPNARQTINLNEIIKNLEPFLKCVLHEDITYRAILQDGEIQVSANSHHLEQILVNLATNARDAMPDGGTLTISSKLALMDEEYIQLHGHGKPGRYAILKISDSGTGMKQETCQRIFEPFFTTKEAGKGTGLGLAVVYAIVKEHAGFIDVSSQPGQGTTFTIHLPVIEASPEEEGTMHQAATHYGGTETILIAEDSDIVRNMTKEVLRGSGYRVITAVDGEDAMIKFTEHGEEIDLLLFDLIMPNMNGIEAFNEIKKVRPDLKIIFASGYAHEIGRQKTLLVDERPFLFKPTTPEELLRKVRSVLDGATP